MRILRILLENTHEDESCIQVFLVLSHEHFVIFLRHLVVFVVEFHAGIHFLGRTEACHSFFGREASQGVSDAS